MFFAQSAVPVFVSGVRGSGSKGNGLYRGAPEVQDGRGRYVKEDDDDWWLEYWAPSKRWQLKQTEHKGKDLSWATVYTDRALHECGSLVWKVAVDKVSGFTDDPDIKIAVGAEALEAWAKVTLLTLAFHTFTEFSGCFFHVSIFWLNMFHLLSILPRFISSTSVDGIQRRYQHRSIIHSPPLLLPCHDVRS